MTQKELDIIGHLDAPFDELYNLKHILYSASNRGILWGLVKVYLYGVIQGKRKERTRRKKSTDAYKYML